MGRDGGTGWPDWVVGEQGLARGWTGDGNWGGIVGQLRGRGNGGHSHPNSCPVNRNTPVKTLPSASSGMRSVMNPKR